MSSLLRTRSVVSCHRCGWNPTQGHHICTNTEHTFSTRTLLMPCHCYSAKAAVLLWTRTQTLSLDYKKYLASALSLETRSVTIVLSSIQFELFTTTHVWVGIESEITHPHLNPGKWQSFGQQPFQTWSGRNQIFKLVLREWSKRYLRDKLDQFEIQLGYYFHGLCGWWASLNCDK